MTDRRVVVDHVGILVQDLAISRSFYEAALAPLGFGVIYEDPDGVAFGVQGADDFSIHQDSQPTCQAHVAFIAEDRTAVDEFYVAALANGGREKSAPTLHLEYHAGYYAAYVWDPDGNNIEAVYHDRDCPPE
jgi:catechol 2,3-dioxygenase-like lactoylglutathione lyase family enzyme